MKIFAYILVLFASTAIAQVPGVTAQAFIVTELDGTVILEKNANEVRPIASITKLLVAERLVPKLYPNKIIKVEANDLASKNTKLKIHAELDEEQLARLSLISSNNSAIYALVRSHGTDSVIQEVNDVAIYRGLATIHIEEPSGLSPNNRASAHDLAKFMRFMLDSPASAMSIEKSVDINKQTFRSTNPLLGKYGWNFTVSKTGFIRQAGGCLVAIVEIGARPVIIVILGSQNVSVRWTDLMKIRSSISKEDRFWSLSDITQRKKNEFKRNTKSRKKNN